MRSHGGSSAARGTQPANTQKRLLRAYVRQGLGALLLTAISATAAAQSPPPPPPAAPPTAQNPAPEPPPAENTEPVAPPPAESTEPAPPPAPPAPPPENTEPAPEPEPPAALVEAPEAEPEEEGAQGDAIVVTGSRIRDSVGKQAPVTTLSSTELQRPGLIGVGEVLQRLPASGSAINGTFNSSGNQGNPPDGGGVGAGATEIDLRYLGSKRTLVLVDGVRWINGSSASGVAASVDLNTIPLNMIERIEVLEDGASPIYGSDAISGVINIITKKNFQGAAASAYLGGYGHGDGLTQKYDLTFGATQGRLSIVAGGSFIDQNEVRSRDRYMSRSPVPTLDSCESGCSGATPQGRFLAADPSTGDFFDLSLNNGTGVPSYPRDYHAFGNPDRFNFSPYNFVLIPSRRINAFSSVVYKIADWINFSAKAAYTRRESVNQAGPEPLFVGPEGGTGTRMDRLSVDATNPYNPFGFTFDANSSYLIARRPVEAGPRRFEQTVNTFYTSGGFDGKFKLSENHEFIWNTTVAYGVNSAAQRRKNSFNSSKLGEALGPAFLDANNNWRCGTASSPGPDDCVPFNIFGGQGPDGRGTITREMLDYVTYTQHDVSEQRLFDWVANLSGPIVKLPGGPLAVGVGVEHRRLQGIFEPDAVVAAGDSADIPAKPTTGQFHVSEAYAELRAPFIANVPGFSLLDFNAAGRVSDYSFLSPELTGKIGGRYKPIDDLVIRGSYGLGFRAPSIGELYGAASRFDATIVDKCSDLNNVMDDAVRQRCIALGVPADGSYSTLNPQTSVATGGNRDLQPERSKSLSVSIAYAPAPLQDQRWSDRFDVEVAFFQILLDGAIAARDSQLQLDRCIEGDDASCTGITRTAAGSINGFSNRLLNINSIVTRGLDFKLNYQTSMLPIGRLRARWYSSWLLDFWEKVPKTGGVEKVALEGLVRGEPEKAYPAFKSNLALEWMFGDFTVMLGTRYIHSVREPCRGLNELPNNERVCSDYATDDNDSTNLLAVRVYNDARVTWNPAFDDRLMVNVGVNNLFNVDPPLCYSCALNGFNGATYDVPGVFAYINAGYSVQ
jgi:iron complex outermembrane recepter protein